jgi:hypothetical protein
MNGSPRFSSRLLVVLALLALTVAGIPTNSRAESLLDVGQPGPAAPDAQPDKILVPGSVPGNYYLDYGYTVMDPTQYPVDGAIRFWQWSQLNPASGVYNWAALDAWIKARKDKGLETGILITTYDGSPAGDISATPDYVIEKTDAVLPMYVKGSPSTPIYVNRWPAKRLNYNATFEATPHTTGWTLTGNTSVVSNPPADPTAAAYGWAAQLGGVDNATGTISHFEERIPAMPASLTGTNTVHFDFRVYIHTTDPSPNDHLYVELWDRHGATRYQQPEPC